MTKAERREMQEKQRAAKKEKEAAGETTPAKGKGKVAHASAPMNSPVPGSPVAARGAPSSSQLNTGRAVQVTGQQGLDGPRGSRIFSHFGLPKAPASSTRAQHPIHPAIIRLGLQFSQFKIVGANARCIATLIALRTVRIIYPMQQRY